MKPSNLTWVAFLGLFFFSVPALAQQQLMTPTGGRGQLAIDQIAGFRASTVGGFSYYAPLGFSIQRYSLTDYGGRGDTVVHYTNFWIAPSADFFVIDHLSIGGLIEFTSTSGSVDRPINPGASANYSLPTTTNFTVIPRVGYLVAIGNRFGIWPRGGIGYASHQTVDTANPPFNARETFSSWVFDANCSFLYRINETFFLSAAPEITFALGGSHSTVLNNGATVSADANFFQFAVTGGMGVLLNL